MSILIKSNVVLRAPLRLARWWVRHIKRLVMWVLPLPIDICLGVLAFENNHLDAGDEYLRETGVHLQDEQSNMPWQDLEEGPRQEGSETNWRDDTAVPDRTR